MRKRFLVIFIVLVSENLILNAQNPPHISPEQQAKSLKRWILYQPSVRVALKNGDTLTGQPIHFNMEEFLIYPSEGLPLGMEDLLEVIPNEDIERIWLNRGGRITAAQTTGIISGIAAGTGLGFIIGGPVGALIGGNLLGVTGGFAGKALHRSATYKEIWLNPSSLDYGTDLMKLRTWSVFEDSLFHTDELEELPVHSAAVRRAFPQKQFRISMGVNVGIRSFLEKNLQDVTETSGLPAWNGSFGSLMGLEYLDFSWRIHPHWAVGTGMMTEPNGLFNIYYYPQNQESEANRNYSYWMNLTDVRFYTEYVLNPVDRFFTTHGEFLFGGGLIISLPETGYNYSELNPGTGIQESSYFNERNTVFGFQLRGTYHQYLARNFSLSGGVEANLYQNLKLPGLEQPEGYTGDYFGFRDHTLNYSTIRFKLGANLYF